MALTNWFGMYGFMWIFSSSSFTAALFTYFFIPETKGKSIEAISQMFKGATLKNRKDLYA